METFRCKIELIQKDITTLAVDAIVNAANDGLSPGLWPAKSPQSYVIGLGGGVCGAIFRAAGMGLYSDCRKLGGCDTGDAVITRAHDIKQIKGMSTPTRNNTLISLLPGIIHAVGPIVYNGVKDKHRQLLGRCYQRSLRLAKNNNMRSIVSLQAQLVRISSDKFRHSLAYPPGSTATRTGTLRSLFSMR